MRIGHLIQGVKWEGGGGDTPGQDDDLVSVLLFLKQTATAPKSQIYVLGFSVINSGPMYFGNITFNVVTGQEFALANYTCKDSELELELLYDWWLTPIISSW
jgi:hypothetical protein